MTILYKPVLIETAEQAGALPAKALIGAGGFSGSWITLTYPEDADWGAGDFPFRALVPIEAEEQHGARGDGENEEFYYVSRLVTPWEEA